MERKKILIIDDEPSFTRLVKRNLEKTGKYQVWEENQGAEAVQTARNVNPGLILLDIIMPSTSGTVIASQLRSDNVVGRTPVVFLTAVVPKEKAADQKSLGGFPFLAKPAAVQEIIDCIEANLPRAEA